jgi:formylglycine-generating enzyme
MNPKNCPVHGVHFSSSQIEKGESTQMEEKIGRQRSGIRQLLELAPGVTMEFVQVPAGEFIMGSPEGEGSDDEHPQHTVCLDTFYMGRYAVTNAQYLTFVEATGCDEPWKWNDSSIPEGEEDHPVGVNWYNAAAFCQWAAEVTGEAVRLPTEAEWEKAARGTDGRTYPWGDERLRPQRANYSRHMGNTTSVDRYSPQGDSPYGCADMLGNAWEWTADWYDPASYARLPQKNPTGPAQGDQRVLRGGSWYDVKKRLRCAARLATDPGYVLPSIGFRVCFMPPQPMWSRIRRRLCL